MIKEVASGGQPPVVGPMTISKLISMSPSGLARWIWDSPTLTTWASFIARAFGLLLVLPLLLRHFSPAEVTVWYLFTNLAAFQLLADVGFSPTFSRFVGYAMGGARNIENPSELAEAGQTAEINRSLLARLYATMNRLYVWISIGALISIGIGGGLALRHPAAVLDQPNRAWLAFSFLITSTIVSLRGNAYSSFLFGTNQVALLRRWETLFAAGAVITSFVALFMHGRLIALTLSSQSWIVLGVLRNRWLAKRWLAQHQICPDRAVDFETLRVAWAAAWRTVIAYAMSHGLMFLSAIVAAQQRDAKASAAYLLGLNLIRNINTVSQAPFYTKLPLYAHMFAQRRVPDLLTSAARSMRLAYMTYVLPYFALAISGRYVFHLIGSRTPFPSSKMWIAMGTAFFLERYGAMHLQLFSLTNRILAHVANGVSGVLIILIGFVLYPRLGLLALPLAMALAYLCFYAWYSAALSHRAFSLPWPKFDFKAGAYAACGLIIVSAFLM